MKHTLYKYIGMAFLGLVCWLAVPSAANAQCPMCKAAVESGHGEEPNPLAEGLNTGIIYLFVLPYVTFGLIGLIWYMSYRRKKQRELGEELNEAQQTGLPEGLRFKDPGSSPA